MSRKKLELLWVVLSLTTVRLCSAADYYASETGSPALGAGINPLDLVLPANLRALLLDNGTADWWGNPRDARWDIGLYQTPEHAGASLLGAVRLVFFTRPWRRRRRDIAQDTGRRRCTFDGR